MIDESGYDERTRRMLDKVRKLLTKAEDPAVSEHEALALNEKAEQLIADYGIEMAHVAQSDPNADKMAKLKMYFPNPYAIDKAILANTIATAFRCKAIYTWPGYLPGSYEERKGKALIVVGFKSDLLRLDVYYTSLLLQMEQGAIEAEIWEKPHWENGKAFKASYYQGFTSAVGVRLRKSEKKAVVESTSTGTDLVVADRSALVVKTYEELFPDAKKSASRQGSNGSGRHAGYRDGQKAHMGGNSLAGARKAIG